MHQDGDDDDPYDDLHLRARTIAVLAFLCLGAVLFGVALGWVLDLFTR
jgi:hypothetical protein